ncbi:MAG TPA: HD domain-containing phosphohydrolase [Thermodesulfobacteriota bacterium]|nr:HD domain-containing phosphohydrolase [Thermodesulfobacteriota bacterium]
MGASNFEQRLITVLQQINVAVANIRIYFWDHPEVTQRLDLAYGEIHHFLSIKPKLTLIVYNNRLVVDEKPILSDAPHITQFINLLTDKGIEYLRFQSGLTRKELEELLIGLAKNEPVSMQRGKAIRYGKIKNEPEGISGGDGYPMGEMDSHEPDLSLENEMETVIEFYGNIRQSKSLHVPTLFDLANTIIGYIQRNQYPFKMLTSIRNWDEYTFAHAINVCILTVSLAESLGFSGKQLHEIGIASLLHDVGKLCIPDAILNKNGKPTAEEWRIIRNHPLRGAMQLQKMKGVPKIAILGALEHHMQYDGGGYPQLPEYKPSIVSQMIAIADTYDALRSNRPYQPSKSHEVAVGILTKEKGTRFEPFMVDHFIGLTVFKAA